MNNRLLFGLLATTVAIPPLAIANRPNILVIVADDLGFHDVGFNGLTDFETPNIDAIAANGIVCRNGYASHPYCAPTRAGLLTGRYQHRFGFEGNPAHGSTTEGLPPSEATIADVLSAAGYETIGIGKWHLGEADHFHPVRRGFQSYFGFLEGSRSYFKTDCQWWTRGDNDSIVSRPPSATSRKEYLTDLLTDEAIKFIRKPSDKPFFMYLAYNAPHSPMQATPDWLDQVADIPDKKRRTYAAMVTSMDDGIGRVRAAIEEVGAANNTLVFFFSDNGGIGPVNAADNTPFRGLKGTLLEGGIHVPFVVSWPKVLPKGEHYDGSVMTFDVFRTATVAAGVNDSQLRDSVDLVPFLTGKEKGVPHSTLFWRTGQGFQLAARRADFKYLHINGIDDRYFDLAKNVTEQNVSEQSGVSDVPEPVAESISAAAKEWSASLPEALFTGHGLKLEAQWRAVGLQSAPSGGMSP